MKKLLIAVFILFFGIYYISAGSPTPYDYFTRLSDSFLEGKFYINENPPWLSELIPAGQSKFYVAYPPMAAILAMPLRALWGEGFHQEYLAQLLGAGIVIIAMSISWNVKKDKRLLVWSGALSGLGTIMWFMASVGSSWYLGQITAAFFLMFAILESISKKRPVFVGIFIGAAYLARLQTILVLPLFIYLLKDEQWFNKCTKLALGIAPFIIFNSYYNFSRFGLIFEQGYYLIPGVLEEPWYHKGLFNLAYIPSHLEVIFGALPKFANNFPYVTPSWGGLAIWITTPAFIYSLLARLKEPEVKLSWLSIILISLVIFSHGTTGFAQFGYRFAVDFYPILIFLTIKGVARTGVKWHHWVLLAWAIIVNLWGVVWINKFEWVGF